MQIPAQMPRRYPAKLALVGEAPGADEELEGRPFVGRAGRILNGALATAGIRREDVYLGNVFDTKAPDNNVDPWMRDPAIYEPALARLADEMARVEPTVIVPMGNTPVWAFTEMDENITRLRGSPLKATRVAPGTKLLPTFHPSYVGRIWKMLPVLIGDLLRAQAEAEKGPDIEYPWSEFTLEPSFAAVVRWMYGGEHDKDGVGYNIDSRGERFPALFNADLLSVDIETGWGQITCIAFAPDAEHAISIPFVDLREADKSYWDTAETEAKVWGMVKDILEDRRVPKLGQNYTYDAYWLLDQMGIRTYNYLHDTRLMQHAIAPEMPKDLAFLAAAHTSMQWKHWGKKGEKRDD